MPSSLVAVQEHLVPVFGQPPMYLLRPADIGAGVTDEHVRHECLPRPGRGRIEKVHPVHRPETSNELPQYGSLGRAATLRPSQPGRLQKRCLPGTCPIVRLTCAHLGNHRRRATATRRGAASILEQGGEPGSRQVDELLDERLKATETKRSRPAIQDPHGWRADCWDQPYAGGSGSSRLGGLFSHFLSRRS